MYSLSANYSIEQWNLLTTPGTDSYHPLWAPILLLELFGNLAVFWVAILAAILYWRKMRSFPLIYIIAELFTAVVLITDTALAASFEEGVLEEEPGETARTTGATH